MKGSTKYLNPNKPPVPALWVKAAFICRFADSLGPAGLAGGGCPARRHVHRSVSDQHGVTKPRKACVVAPRVTQAALHLPSLWQQSAGDGLQSHTRGEMAAVKDSGHTTHSHEESEKTGSFHSTGREPETPDNSRDSG